jgi:hypothetical protein
MYDEVEAWFSKKTIGSLIGWGALCNLDGPSDSRFFIGSKECGVVSGVVAKLHVDSETFPCVRLTLFGAIRITCRTPEEIVFVRDTSVAARFPEVYELKFPFVVTTEVVSDSIVFRNDVDLPVSGLEVAMMTDDLYANYRILIPRGVTPSYRGRPLAVQEVSETS